MNESRMCLHNSLGYTGSVYYSRSSALISLLDLWKSCAPVIYIGFAAVSFPVHFRSKQCSAVQFRVVQGSALQCSAMQCSAMQCSAVQCSAVYCGALQCSVVKFTKSNTLCHDWWFWDILCLLPYLKQFWTLHVSDQIFGPFSFGRLLCCFDERCQEEQTFTLAYCVTLAHPKGWCLTDPGSLDCFTNSCIIV